MNAPEQPPILDQVDLIAVVAEDELWDGEMEEYEVDGAAVLVVKLDGEYRAYNGICPHQSFSLVEGTLDGTTLTCRAHEWSFDARTGEGINPSAACLVRRAVVVRDGQVQVGRQPLPAAQVAPLNRPQPLTDPPPDPQEEPCPSSSSRRTRASTPTWSVR